MKFFVKPVTFAASLAVLAPLAALAVLAPLAGTASAAALSASVAPLAPAIDNGLAASSDTVEIALTLKVNNLDDLKAFVASTVNPSSANYHQFLSPAQFAARYGQSDAAVQQVKAYLEASGLQVTQVFNNNLVLLASGTNAQLSRLFGTTIHSFTAPSGDSFQRPMTKPAIPAALQGVVASVHGLSTEARFKPHSRLAPTEIRTTATAGSASLKNRLLSATPAATPTFGLPGSYSVKDVAARYNVNPLYASGYTGAGVTLGIMTFAKFNSADATNYWKGVGITRTGTLTTVNAGSGTIGSNGASETGLDVEQAGGLAPGANIILYQAPNTDAGAVALYTKAITDNKADTLSISWGLTELAYGSTDLAPYDTLFLQAAAQGIPVTAASADGGAYDVAGAGYPFPNYSPILSVDFPASHPYVLGAGGTTVPATLNLTHGTVVVPAERPWGWDYLQSYILSYQTAAYYYANLYPVGAGGGVSVQYDLPSYQQGLAGVRTTMPGQSMVCLTKTATNTTTGVQGCSVGDVIVSPLPANFAGRNVPDLSMNADPQTGYASYSTGDGYTGWVTGYGGTSFVAPQLNGIFAVLTQKAGHRLGWLHPQLYGAFKTYGYGSGSPFHSVTTGTNLFWPATNSYNPATGIGTPDVAALATLFN